MGLVLAMRLRSQIANGLILGAHSLFNATIGFSRAARLAGSHERGLDN